MTTANLSVGIKTEEARAELAALKRWLTNEMKDIVFSVDPSSIDRSITAYLKQRTFIIKVHTKALAAEIENDVGLALDRSFAKKRNLAWNQDALRGGLKSAIDATFGNTQRRVAFNQLGLRAEVMQALQQAFDTPFNVRINGTGLTAQVQAAAGAGAVATPLAAAAEGVGAGPLAPALAMAIKSSLAPAIEELGKTAALLGSTVRAAGIKTQTTGKVSASEKVGSVDPATGIRTSLSQPVDADAALARVASQTKALQAAKKAIQEDKAWASYNKLNDESSRAQKSIAFSQAETAALRADLDARGRLNADYTERLKAEIRSRLEANRNANDQIKGFFQAEQDLKKRAQQATRSSVEQTKADIAAELAARRSRSAAFDLIDKQAAEAKRKAFEQAEAEVESTRRGLTAIANSNVREGHKQRVEATKQANREIAALNSEADRVERARIEAMRRFYSAAKAKASEKYSGIGPQIAAAQQLAAQPGVGVEGARRFLGPNKAYLLDMADALESHARLEQGVKKGAAAHKLFAASANDAHSAARGLAGSLGAMWLTWGSTAPLVLGAAVGLAARQTMMIGKDLEYQLRFVSLLTGDARVSMERFSRAIEGSMVAPVEAAKAMRGLAQNGLSTSEALQALPKVLALATAGEMDLTAAALGATGVMAAFNLQVTDIGRIGDVFSKAAAMSNTSVSGMVEAMRQASTVSDKYKVSLEETAASLAVLAKRNIEGSAAGTAFRNMMTELATPSKEAATAMKQMGLNLYDTNNQLLPFQKVMAQLENVVVGLNEKGRLTFLEVVTGNERAAKAASALLADYQLLGKTITTLQQDSEGFTNALVSGLNETTSGKLKALVAAFQLSATDAFDKSANGVKNLIDQMRILVSSPEFKEGLLSIAEGFVSITRFVVENTKFISITVAGWYAARAASSVLTSALAAQAAGYGALRIAQMSLLGPIGIGAGILATLVAGYFALKRETTEASEATEAYANSVRAQTQLMDNEIARGKESIAVLSEKIRLMYLGVEATDAQKRAENSLALTQVDNRAADLKRRRALFDAKPEPTEASDYQRLKEDRARDPYSSAPRKSYQSRPDWLAEKAAIEAEERSISAMKKKSADSLGTERDVRSLGDRVGLLTELERLTAKVNASNEKYNKNFKIINADEARGLENAELRYTIAEAQARLDKALPGYTAPDKTAAEELNRLENAKLQALFKQRRTQEDVLKRSIQVNKELNAVKYSSDEFGPYIAATLAEQAAREESIRLIELESETVRLLNKEKDSGKFSDAGKVAIQTEIDQRTASIETLQVELKARQALEKARSDVKVVMDNRNENKYLASQRDKDADQITKINNKYDLKIVDPVQAAKVTAETEAMAIHSAKIVEAEEQIKDLGASRLRIQVASEGLTGKEALMASEKLGAVDAEIDRMQSLLAARKALADGAVEAAGALAASREAESRTLDYGMKKFWVEYISSAESSAAQVQSIMKTTTDGMGNMFANFVTTGKLGFKSFATSVISDAARIMASRGISQILGMIGSVALSAFGGGTTSAPTGGTGITLGGVRATPNANGNIMTSAGPAALNMYAKGGVARTPQVSVFGEGRSPEAYVPLPDGRSIPVTMSGGAGGGVVANVNVNVMTDGKTKAQSDASGSNAAAVGDMVRNAVLEVISREKRAGGLLYS